MSASEFTELIDLASKRVGGRVLFANDDFFAPKENLLNPAKPIWIDDKYTDRGKWMDGWESRRRRVPGHDWCIVQLGVPGAISQMVVDTSFFRGNFPESCSIDACSVPADSPVDAAESWPWSEVLPQSKLQGDAQNAFAISDPHRYSHLRLHIYPDGGVARLRVFGECIPELRNADADAFNLAAVENGARVLDCSDKFYSSPLNLLVPGRSSGMHDGWETKRRRGPGHDWVVIELGVAGTISQMEVDTAHFKGNYPDGCSLDVSGDGKSWTELLPRTKLEADSVHAFEIAEAQPAKYARFNMYPDGGVARLRLYGRPEPQALVAARLRWLNSLPYNSAIEMFLSCCGARKWAQQMVASRPYESPAALEETSESAFAALSGDDWRQAFAAHPKIGERKVAGTGQSQSWSRQEQVGAVQAASDVQNRLQQRNEEYHARFGHIFIVCATGKSADEMLAILESRIGNEPGRELEIAAAEQRKITQLRLEKLIAK